jgi:hypothetical protein
MPIDQCSLLRLPRSDQPHSFVLVHVADRGKTSLNLKLVATEGEAPYNATGQFIRLIDFVVQYRVRKF